MNKKILTICALLIVLTSCTENASSFQVELYNQADIQLLDQYVELDLTKAGVDNSSSTNYSVEINGTQIPSQIIDDSKLGFTVDLNPKETKVVVVKFGRDLSVDEYENRTYAEISMKVDYERVEGKYSGGRFEIIDSVRVPDDHTDHNALFRYEGPGWESEKIGYRMYIDWRNRTDIFGKKKNELVLKNVGVNDLEAKEDSYHKMQDWGKDIFKVGNSFGIGSFGMMQNEEIVMVAERDSVVVKIQENGPVKSTVEVDYYGWKVGDAKYDLQADLSITAGSRLTEVELNSTNNPENFVTGLAKHPGTEFTQKIVENGWSYISVYGVQTIADYGQPDEPVDNLGIAVIFNSGGKIEQLETDNSYVVMLSPTQGKLTYYFTAAWEQEPDGIKTKEQFYNYLDNVIKSLNNPVTLKY